MYVTHTIDISDNPATGILPFTIANKQCGVIITLYCVDSSATGIREVESGVKAGNVVKKTISDKGIMITTQDGNFNAAGRRFF